MSDRFHRVEQYGSPLPGLEVLALVSNHHFPRHSHDQYGVGVISGGAQRSWSGMGAVTATRGDVIMVNPGEIHDGSPLDQQARSWKMIYFDPKLVAHEVEELRGELPLLRPVVCDTRLVSQIEALFARLCSGCDPLAVEENLLPLLIFLFRQHGAAARFQPMRSSVVKAIQRLDQAPELSVSLSELAALTGLSRFQFLRSFAREVGVTPHAYLMQRRILLVRRLLTKGCTLSQAALHAGFADQSHMTRTFVRQTGITPARYAAVTSRL